MLATRCSSVSVPEHRDFVAHRLIFRVREPARHVERHDVRDAEQTRELSIEAVHGLPRVDGRALIFRYHRTHAPECLQPRLRQHPIGTLHQIGVMT